MTKVAENRHIEMMEKFWNETPTSPSIRKLNAKVLKGDFLSLIERIKFESDLTDKLDEKCSLYMERLQAIIDWCDIAMKNAEEFDSHGVRNLDGPVFDAARELLRSEKDD